MTAKEFQVLEAPDGGGGSGPGGRKDGDPLTENSPIEHFSQDILSLNRRISALLTTPSADPAELAAIEAEFSRIESPLSDATLKNGGSYNELYNKLDTLVKKRMGNLKELVTTSTPAKQTESITIKPNSTLEDNESQEYQRRISEFQTFISDLSNDVNSGTLNPGSSWRGHTNILQYLEQQTTRFEQLVVSPLEISSLVSLREMGYDVRNSLLKQANELKINLQNQLEQTIKDAPGKWKENKKFENEFSEITDLRNILTTDLSTLPDNEVINLFQRITDLITSLLNKLTTSSLIDVDKQLIVKSYIKDVFEFTTSPLKAILEETNEIQTGKKPGTLSDDIDRLRDRYNLFLQFLNSPRFTNAFGSLYVNDIRQLTDRAQAIGQFDQLESFYKEEQLNTMNYEQLARLVVKVNIDPFEYHEARKGGQDAYKALVVSKAKERLFGPNPKDTPWQDHERQRWFVWMSLKFLDDKHQYENQSATGARNDLENHLSLHLLTRDKLARVTYADPIYGAYFEKLIKALRVQAALKPPPESADLDALPTVQEARTKLSSMSASDLRVNNPMMTKEGHVAFVDGEFYVFSDGVKYGTLANESIGRGVMDAYFSRIPKPPGLSEEMANLAQDLASRIYTSFTILDESFYELQASTETRGHNTKEDDYGAVHKQTAAAVHRAMRYAKERVDAIAMWGPFKLNQVPEYYFLNKGAKKEFLHLLSMHRKHQASFYPTELIFEQVDFPPFLQDIFPNTSALFTMQPGERLWIADPAYNNSQKVDDSSLSLVLIDHKRKPLIRRNKNGEIFSLDGKNKLGTIKVAGSSGAGGNNANSSEGSLISGTFEYPNGDLARVPSVKLDVGNDKVSITENIIDTRHYYVAFEGMKEVNELVFSKIPGNLNSDQILNKSSAGTGMLDTLMSAIGKLKMFPSYAIDNLIYPYMMEYILRLVQAYESPRPEERLPLIAEIVRQITRTSHYGGLGRANLKSQIQRVVDNLITDKRSEAIQDNIWPKFHVELWSDSNERVKKEMYAKPATLPYYRWRNHELVEYLEELWHEEFSGIETPPLGNSLKASAARNVWYQRMRWKNQDITPRMRHIIEASTYEGTIPTFLNKKAKFEVSDPEAKKSH